jgi:hypothetical protein
MPITVSGSSSQGVKLSWLTSVKGVLLTTITSSKRTVIFTTALWGSHSHVGWVTSTDSAAEGITIGELCAAISGHTGIGATFDSYHTSVVVMPVTITSISSQSVRSYISSIKDIL